MILILLFFTQKHHQEVRLVDSLGFLGLYLGYILVVLLGRFIHNRNRVDLPYAGLVVVDNNNVFGNALSICW